MYIFIFREIIPYLYGSTNHMHLDLTNDVMQTLKIGDFYYPNHPPEFENVPNLTNLPKISADEAISLIDDDWNPIEISYDEAIGNVKHLLKSVRWHSVLYLAKCLAKLANSQ